MDGLIALEVLFPILALELEGKSPGTESTLHVRWPNCTWCKIGTDSGRYSQDNLEPNTCAYASSLFSLHVISYMQLLTLSQEHSTIGTWPSFYFLGGSSPWGAKHKGRERSEWKGLNFKDWIGFAVKDFALDTSKVSSASFLWPFYLVFARRSRDSLSFMPLLPFYRSINIDWASTVSPRNHPTYWEHSVD